MADLIETGNLQSILALINQNYNINSKDSNGFTLLHYAVMKGKEKIVSLLLHHGADVNSKSYMLITPLHCAAEGHNDEIVRMLINYGADVNSQTSLKSIPLHYAIAGSKKCLSLTNENITDRNFIYKEVSANKQCYFNDQKKEILKLLLKHGSHINQKNLHNWTALNYAVVFCEHDIVSMLLEYSANPNIKNYLQMFPLHYAVEKQKIEVVDLLLQHGANVNVRDFLGKTPLLYAAERLDKSILGLILDHAADVNYRMIAGLLERNIYSERKKFIINTLTIHLIKLKYLNFVPNEETLDYINSHMSIVHNVCEKEIKEMKNITIYKNCNISFYDLLTQNLSKISLYLTNENCRKELITSLYEEMFPMYSSMISHRIRMATVKIELLNETHELLRLLLSNIFVLPYDCTLRIINYFTEADIKFLRSCYKL